MRGLEKGLVDDLAPMRCGPYNRVSGPSRHLIAGGSTCSLPACAPTRSDVTSRSHRGHRKQAGAGLLHHRRRNLSIVVVGNARNSVRRAAIAGRGANLSFVMPGLVPGIHVLLRMTRRNTPLLSPCEERKQRGNPVFPAAFWIASRACHRARIRATRWLDDGKYFNRPLTQSRLNR